MRIKNESLFGLLFIGVAGLLWWKNKDAITTAINPTDPNNVANKTANATWQYITGDPTATIATSAFNVLNSPNASPGDLSSLVNFFDIAGVSAATQAQAKGFGWTDADIQLAIQTVQLNAFDPNAIPPLY